MPKRQEKDKDQLGLLTHCDNIELSKFKKEDRLTKTDKDFVSRSDTKPSDEFFDNLISVEELAVIFGLAPQTIRNWIALGKIPHVKIGRRRFFQKRSLQEWLNQKEEPQWR